MSNRLLPGAWILWVWLISLAVSGLVAQQSPSSSSGTQLVPRTKEEREREFQARHHITLNVLVTDAAGKPVSGLSEGDFTLLDNGQPQKVTTFRAMDGSSNSAEVHVLVVLDATNSTEHAFETEREGLAKYLSQVHEPLPYPVSIILFANSRLRVSNATTNGEALGKALSDVTKGAHAEACAPLDGTAAHALENVETGGLGGGGIGGRAVSIAACLETHFKNSVAVLALLAKKQKEAPGRTLLIWAGPGWPLLSDPEFQKISPSAQQGFFNEMVAISDDMRVAQVTLDEVSPRDSTREAEIRRVDLHALINGTASAHDTYPSSMALQVLAPQTGGRVIADSKDISSDLSACVGDANSYYALSFDSKPSSGPIEYHSLDVKVNKQGMTPRTVTGYYEEP